MARVFITGSTDGLGRAAGQTLLSDGHNVVVRARNGDRLTALRDLVDRGAATVVGDLADPDQTRNVAHQLNEHASEQRRADCADRGDVAIARA